MISRILAVSAALLMVTAGSAQAAEKDSFGVVVHTTFDDEADVFEGGTLDGCETGTVETYTQALPGTPWGGHFTGQKVFSCAGGLGGFTVELSANFGGGGSVGTWTIVSSWGSEAGLRGRGTLVGVSSDAGIDDYYTGWSSGR